ncbi:MAG TPA: preprotein translocase subunit YajC [Phycisphaerales bacterium]|nr:preprotein translocase subunit YajC [Phycisphaerales bacterium]
MTDIQAFDHPALTLLAQAGQPVQPAGMPNAQPAPVQATPGTGAATPGGAPAGQASPWGQMGLFLPLIAVFGVIMIMSFLSQRKEKKKREELMASMRKGDKVQTFSGIIGTLTELTDHEAVLRVEEGRIRVARTAIQTVLSSKSSGSSIEPKNAKAEAEQPVNA